MRPRIAIAQTVPPIPIPALATLLSPLPFPKLLPLVGNGEEIFDDTGLAEVEYGTGLEFDEEGDIFEDEELNTELEIAEENDGDGELEVEVELGLAEDENVLAANLVLDVNVTPTGSSSPILPFGSSATSWA